MPDHISGENTLTEIKKALGTDENPVSTAEMSEFWKSLSDEEKAAFKSEDLGQQDK